MSALYIISEIMIFVLGATCIYLLSRNDDLSKWGMVVGLISEPFWFYSAYHSGSWGIFALSVIYTLSYLNGIKNWFGEKKKKRK